MSPAVLVVSWDAEVADALARELRAEGYAVATETQDGARAYRMVRDQPPAAVVVDLRRRPSHGRAVIASLDGTASTRDVPVLVIDETESVGAQPVAERLRALLPPRRSSG